MRRPSDRVLLATPVVAAVVLALSLTWLAAVTARTLRQRDEAVREGILLRLGAELVAQLREVAPDDAAATVDGFIAAHPRELAGVSVDSPHGTLLHRGGEAGRPSEVAAALGPRWRAAMGPGGHEGGPGWRAALRLRLYPATGLGTSGSLAAVVVVGAALAALALVAFSLVGVAGLAQRQRLVAAEAERRRLEALALAGSGLAHRIRNPLAGIKGTTQLLLEGAAPPVATRARRILDAAERIDTLLARLLTFARPPEASPEVVDLRDVVARVMARTGGAVSLHDGEGITAWADGEHVESIVEELLANARAFDPDDELEVTVRREGRVAIVEVADRGPGLSVDPERAFDPYVTTRAEGTGLGLAIVRALARANGGEIRLGTRPGGGTVARLALPLEER